LPTLCEGGFVERGENLLAFGLPGRGKTHIVCAIGHELVQRGYPVLSTPTYALLQRLLAAKRDLRLERGKTSPIPQWLADRTGWESLRGP
jgi:DNA replication protein DnaC